jgi:hypothetical protein
MVRQLKRIELGSSCCGATVYDPGGTWEWLCTDCKEHCSEAYIQQISLMVLTTDGRAHHHILTYDQQEDKDNDMDDRVQSMVDKLYNINDCRYVYKTDIYCEFLDHSL